VIRQPDVLIVEGLNVLQTGTDTDDRRVFVSDFFDFSIYVDADEDDILRWYVERFRRCATPRSATRGPTSPLRRSPTTRRTRSPPTSGSEINGATCARTCCRPAPGRT
jgi:pantothenate kinase